MAFNNGIDIDNIEKIKSKVYKEAYEKYEQEIRNRKIGEGKKLCIEAYESILDAERKKELILLNQERHKEIEKNRPPEPGWYTKTDKEFSKELYRNRVALKPNNSNK